MHDDSKHKPGSESFVQLWLNAGRTPIPAYHATRTDGHGGESRTTWTLHPDPVAGLAWAMNNLPEGASVDAIRFQRRIDDNGVSWRCELSWR